MIFRDITKEKENIYTLKENEQCVFFLLNRSGDITFELAGTQAAAHIFAFFIGKKSDQMSLHITQKHLAPHTTSRMLIKSIASGSATCAYEGLIAIDEVATGSDASQESRALLLSPEASVSMKPILEIQTSDVKCHHAATASPLDREALFFAEARGLSPAQAKDLLIQGFFSDALAKIENLGMNTDKIKNKLFLSIHSINYS